MEDTVTLRIYNFEKYRLSYERFYIVPEKKKQVSTGLRVVNDEGVVSEKQKRWQSGTFYSDTGKWLPAIITGTIYHSSSSYFVRYSVKHTGYDPICCYLEIEFSLPKYFYGTNVFQFIGFPEMNSEANYANFINGVRRFVSDNFF